MKYMLYPRFIFPERPGAAAVLLRIGISGHLTRGGDSAAASRVGSLVVGNAPGVLMV